MEVVRAASILYGLPLYFAMIRWSVDEEDFRGDLRMVLPGGIELRIIDGSLASTVLRSVEIRRSFFCTWLYFSLIASTALVIAAVYDCFGLHVAETSVVFLSLASTVSYLHSGYRFSYQPDDLPRSMEMRATARLFLVWIPAVCGACGWLFLCSCPPSVPPSLRPSLLLCLALSSRIYQFAMATRPTTPTVDERAVQEAQNAHASLQQILQQFPPAQLPQILANARYNSSFYYFLYMLLSDGFSEQQAFPLADAAARGEYMQAINVVHQFALPQLIHTLGVEVAAAAYFALHARAQMALNGSRYFPEARSSPINRR